MLLEQRHNAPAYLPPWGFIDNGRSLVWERWGRGVTLPIGLQSWTHTFANEPQECPLSAQQGLGVAFIAT